MEPKVLTIDDRIRLRPWRVEDVSALQEMADDAQIARNMGRDFPHPYTPEEAEKWIRHNLGIYAKPETPERHWCIEIDGDVAGGAGAHEFDMGHCTIGYWLGRTHWGNGYMTRIVTAMTRYLFEEGVMRIQAKVFPFNPGSARVLEKNGFKQEGYLRKSHQFPDGKYADEYLYAKLRDD